MRLFKIVVLLLIGTLFQSCTVYQKTPVSIEEAQNKGKVKVVNSNGQQWKFDQIVFIDSIYYGINSHDKTQIEDKQINHIYRLNSLYNWSIGPELGWAFPENNSNNLPALYGICANSYFNGMLISSSVKFSRKFKSNRFPSDFERGTIFAPPEDKISVLTISFGKIINPKSKLLRFTLEGGLSGINYKEAHYILKQKYYGSSSSVVGPLFKVNSHEINYGNRVVNGRKFESQEIILFNWSYFSLW